MLLDFTLDESPHHHRVRVLYAHHEHKGGIDDDPKYAKADVELQNNIYIILLLCVI